MKRAADINALQNEGAVLHDGATSKRQKVVSEAVLTQAAVTEKPAAGLEIIVHPAGKRLDQHPYYEADRLYSVIGQRMQLQVRSTRPGARLDQVRWTIDPDTVARCVQVGTVGTAEPIADAALSDANISFFWITGGAKNVQVTAMVDDEQATATATVEVLAPTDHWFRCTTSNVSVCQDGQYLHPYRWLALYEHAPDERYGCTWHAQVRAPLKQIGTRRLGAGQVGFIQVCGFCIVTFDFAEKGVPDPHLMCSADAANNATAVDFGDEEGSILYGPEKMVEAGALLRRAEWRWEAEVSRLDITEQTSPWGEPTNVIVFPTPHQQADAQATHIPPTWSERAATILARGPNQVKL